MKWIHQKIWMLAMMAVCWGLFVTPALAQKFDLLGTTLMREVDCPTADSDYNSGYHFLAHLKKRSGVSSSLSITDYAINGTSHSALPDTDPDRNDVNTSKYWLCSPNPVSANGIVTLRIRLAQGAVTFPTMGSNYTLTLTFNDSSTQDITVTPEVTDLWIPFVYISDNLKDLTVYVGNKGTETIYIPATGGLKINNSVVTYSTPALNMAPGDVIPLSVSLPSALTEYQLTLFEVTNDEDTESAFGSMRAIKSTFDANFWFQFDNEDETDMAKHFCTPDTPGRNTFQDEPFGTNKTAQSLADRVEDSWQNNPSRVVMNQYTGQRENQVYAGLCDIQMNHYQERDLELAHFLTWPHPVWYLPQIAWARTENSQNPTTQEKWYRLEFFRREAFEALGHGAKDLNWFIHQNLWEQGFVYGGGTDMARNNLDVYFLGAVANPVLWDRIGRVSAMMEVLEPYMANSAPSHEVEAANGLEINTVISGDTGKAVIWAIDKATPLQEFYRASDPAEGVNLTVFEDVTIEATVPAWLSANKAYLVDMYDGVSEISFTKNGTTASFTLNELREAAAIVLGTSSDLSALQARWDSVSDELAEYGDDDAMTLDPPAAEVLPHEWLHRLTSSEKTYSVDIHPDGSKVLVGSGHIARMIDSDTRQVLWEDSYGDRVFSVKFSNDGTLFYVAMNLTDVNIGSYVSSAIRCYNLAGTEQWTYNTNHAIHHMVTGFSDNGVAVAIQDSEDPGRTSYIRKLTSAGGEDWVSPDVGWTNYPRGLKAAADGGVLYLGRADLRRYDGDGNQMYSGLRESGAYNGDCGMSADGKVAAFAGNHLHIYREADSSNPQLLSTTPYLGRNIRKIEIVKSGADYFIAAGTCDGIFKIFLVNGSTWAISQVAADVDKTSYVSDIVALPNGGGFACVREIFAYSEDTMWRYRDAVQAYDLNGNTLWRNEGRWRSQPFMTEAVLSETNNRMAVLAGTDVRLVDVTVESVSNSELPEEPLYYLPPPWKSTDVGSVEIPGFADFSPMTQNFTVYGSGQWWNQTEWAGNPIGTRTADEFHYTYLELAGDCSIVARIADFQQSGSYCLGGIMMRETLEAGSKYYGHLYFKRQPYGNKVFYRTATDDVGNSTYVNDGPLEWLRIDRSGDTFTAYMSVDGSDWGTAVDTRTISMSSTITLGLVANSDTYNGGGLVRITYDNVEVTGTGLNSYGEVLTSVGPEGARAQGAQWKVQGESGWLDHNAGYPVAPGSYTVIFKDIPSWYTPEPVSVTIPASGWYSTAIGLYEAMPPAEAKGWGVY